MPSKFLDYVCRALVILGVIVAIWYLITVVVYAEEWKVQDLFEGDTEGGVICASVTNTATLPTDRRFFNDRETLATFGIAYNNRIGRMAILQIRGCTIRGDGIFLRIDDDEGTISLPITKVGEIAFAPVYGTLLYRLKKGRKLEVTVRTEHQPIYTHLDFTLKGSSKAINQLPIK